MSSKKAKYRLVVSRLGFTADRSVWYKSRLSLFAVFGLNGAVLAFWAVYIPVITYQTATSSALLGVLLFLMGIGAVLGMRVGGRLADVFGSRCMVIVYSLGLCLAMMPLGAITASWQLGVVLFLVGVCDGGLGVAMNLQATALEVRYKRPIMSAFHGFYSIGMLVGSSLGALLLFVKASPSLTFLGVGSAGAVTAVMCWPYLLHILPKDTPLQIRSTVRLSRQVRLRVALLGGLAFLLMLSEGVANDWSALQIQSSFGVFGAAAGLGCIVFSLAMTLGRLMADKIVARVGSWRMVQSGSLLAAAGILLVVIAPWLPLALAGWGIFGLGLAGCVPQFFTVAEKISDYHKGVIMARVVSVGYVGLLAGPALIGWLSKWMPLSAALLLPFVLTLVSAVSARFILEIRQKEPTLL